MPLKFRDTLSYRLAPGMEVSPGSWVRVPVGPHEYLGVVDSLSDSAPDIGAVKIREITEAVDLPAVPSAEIRFWKELAAYYMCTTGEVFKAFCPVSFRKQVEVRRRRNASAVECEAQPLPTLSREQKEVADALRSHFSGTKSSPALLHGVTGSGKTEIYMTLASEVLGKGGSVLYLVPEIAMSRQLQDRLSKVFGESLLIFHSKLTAPRRKVVFDKIASGSAPYIVLGTRSALFLPMRGLKFVIVDEEHDSSYKQEDPAPRYNGRDAALLKASIYGADVLLGSATPSFETLYNVAGGKFFKVSLLRKFGGSPEPTVKIIDTIKAARLRSMKGSFAVESLNAVRKCVDGGGQVLVLRSRRAYSSAVQCSGCGAVPLCPKCNVPLSYHKFKDSLVCHYCGRTFRFTTRCDKCGAEAGLELKGAGTERIEEELSEYFPSYRVARFDADTAESNPEAERILKSFADGSIDILVGTQMITKGFDFDGLNLVVVVSADSLLAVQDFRADEKALQMLRQFRGRAGRRSERGRMLVQTANPLHPVFARLTAGGEEEDAALTSEALAERRTFGFPPYVRMILLKVKDRSEGQVWHICRDIGEMLASSGVDYTGPVAPQQDFQCGQHIRDFWIKLPRNRALAPTKTALEESLAGILLRYRHAPQLTIDVDPL